jgi:hypothetical protein
MTNRLFVSSLTLLLLSLPANGAWAQGVEPYPDAITNRMFYPKTPMAPPPANTPFVDPDLGGLMVRVTNGNSNPKVPGSYFRNPPPDLNVWSMDNSKFYVAGENSTNLAFAFNPETMTVGALPGAGAGGGFVVPLRPGPSFSFLDPDLMYGTQQKHPLTIATYRFSTGKVTPIFDTTTCNTQPPLVAGKGVSSSDNVLSSDDNRIVISAGGNAFGSRPFAIVYDQKLGCRWYNTETGQVGGAWGPSGQVSTSDRFPINHSKISGNGQYVRIDVGISGFYVWDVTSLNVQSCTTKGEPEFHCHGYSATGYSTYINAPGIKDELNTFRRPLGDLGDLDQLINPLPQPYYWGMEKTFAWNNGRLNDNVPVCGATYSPSGDQEVKQPYDGEIFCIETDGIESTVWRFAHDRSVWDSEYYWTQPYGNMTLDGRFFAFTSGWDLQVGTDKDGDPRTDVWILKLQ